MGRRSHSQEFSSGTSPTGRRRSPYCRLWVARVRFFAQACNHRNRVEELPGTAVHEALLARFGESDRDVFFRRGAIRYVTTIDHTTIDHLHLELMVTNLTALSNAINALSSRWASVPAVEVEFIGPPGLVSASGAQVLQDLRRRLDSMDPATG